MPKTFVNDVLWFPVQGSGHLSAMFAKHASLWSTACFATDVSTKALMMDPRIWQTIQVGCWISLKRVLLVWLLSHWWSHWTLEYPRLKLESYPHQGVECRLLLAKSIPICYQDSRTFCQKIPIPAHLSPALILRFLWVISGLNHEFSTSSYEVSLSEVYTGIHLCHFRATRRMTISQWKQLIQITIGQSARHPWTISQRQKPWWRTIISTKGPEQMSVNQLDG